MNLAEKTLNKSIKYNEEPLIFDQGKKGRIGVDVPNIRLKKNRRRLD